VSSNPAIVQIADAFPRSRGSTQEVLCLGQPLRVSAEEELPHPIGGFNDLLERTKDGWPEVVELYFPL
jgi:hypothetical protein